MSLAGRSTAISVLMSEVAVRMNVIGADETNSGFNSDFGKESRPPFVKYAISEAENEKTYDIKTAYIARFAPFIKSVENLTRTTPAATITISSNSSIRL